MKWKKVIVLVATILEDQLQRLKSPIYPVGMLWASCVAQERHGNEEASVLPGTVAWKSMKRGKGRTFHAM